MTDPDLDVGWGHDGDWCRDCQDGCGDTYGGSCDCCMDATDPERAEEGQ